MGDEQFYWQGQEGVLYHTESDAKNAVIPWFNDLDDAKRFLENKEEQEPDRSYSDFTLYRVKQNGHYRELEATEVLTEQQGLDAF